jgi:hypothetical protein
MRVAIIFTIVAVAVSTALAREPIPVLKESFDGVLAPALPPGWLSSRHRSPNIDDFSSTASSSNSQPNAAYCANATVEQWIVSPTCSFSTYVPDRLQLWLRRSATFNAPLVVEASLDGGLSFPVQIGDTLRPSGSTSYEVQSLVLPARLKGESNIHFRLRVIPDKSGTSGTLRIDDIVVTAGLQVDVAIAHAELIQAVRDGISVTIHVTLLNDGDRLSAATLLRFAYLRNADLIERPPENLGQTIAPGGIAPGDSSSAEFSTVVAPPGGVIVVSACSPPEYDPSEDSLCFPVTVPFGNTSLLVNEIMYDPLAGTPEWVEVVNMRSESIALSRWQINDGSAALRRVITSSAILPPAAFAVLTRDSAVFKQCHLSTHCLIVQVTNFPSLNNTSDDFIVYDPSGATIDSVHYSSTWHSFAVIDPSGRSLERISTALSSNDPRNWTTSMAATGGTPGEPNSVATTAVSSRSRLSCAPNPFSPDGDGMDDNAIVRYELPLRTSMVSLSVFNVRGRRVRKLMDHAAGGLTGLTVWDGRDDNGMRVPIGMYILLLQAASDGGESTFEAKTTIVVATRL